MEKMWIARDESGAIFIHRHKPEKRKYDRQGIVWESTDYWQLYHRDFPEVTFENSPMEVELKLVKPRKKPEPYKPEYVEFEGVVETVYKNRTLHCNYSVRADHRFFFDGYSRDFALKSGFFTKATAPKVGDRVLLRYRKTKKHGTDKEYFDFIKAKIIKVI